LHLIQICFIFNDFDYPIGDIAMINCFDDFPSSYLKCFNNCSPGVLKINETDFVWLDIVDEDNFAKIIEMSGDNQAVLSEFSKNV